MNERKISANALFTCMCGWSGFFSQLSPIERTRKDIWKFDFLCPASGCNATLAHGSVESGLFVGEGVLSQDSQNED